MYVSFSSDSLCVISVASAQWDAGSGRSLQGLGGEYAVTLCSLQGAETVHCEAAEIRSLPEYEKQ